MTKEEVLHLATLARIELSPEEIVRFGTDFDAILSYVARIKDLAGSDTSTPHLGVVHNVFREDADPHEPGLYTESLLAAAPTREKEYIKVKKILENNNG
ncbi:Asp-tRNA(Asn)/Glu-tRNA(Gln) amidotransferase subunit GatC [Patescibacteria group bacterium]|nr:Asp-tRNA(Asn)/Glu-tRNA(Gln) amidotransferase subunit GatC [Patescibacteria group bacterium]